jgi:bacterioferritin (cytochrome b1)
MGEIHRAEWVIRRDIVPGGAPVVAKLNPIWIGQTVLEMVSYDQDTELAGIRACNDPVGPSPHVAGQATVDLRTMILKLEEVHV